LSGKGGVWKEESMRRAFVVFPAIVLLLAVSPAFSTPILDQHQDAWNYSGVRFNSTGSLGQTFTAGLSGLLDHIDVAMLDGSTYPTTVEIRDTASGMPGSNILGSVYMSSGFLPGWTSIYFLSQSIPMSPGSMYSIVFWNNDPVFTDGVKAYEYDPSNPSADPYPGGRLWVTGGSGWITLGSTFDGDMLFRTYVETIPAPGAIVLAGIGATLVGWLRRRRAV
jgi:hypothetical protein